jgi:hypothetical protein
MLAVEFLGQSFQALSKHERFILTTKKALHQRGTSNDKYTCHLFENFQSNIRFPK